MLEQMKQNCIDLIIDINRAKGFGEDTTELDRLLDAYPGHVVYNSILWVERNEEEYQEFLRSL